MDIAELNLSVRDFNAVKRFGINSTEKLIERLPDFCKEHRRTGAKVTEALHKLGLLPFHLGESNMVTRIAAQGWKRVPSGVDPSTYVPSAQEGA